MNNYMSNGDFFAKHVKSGDCWIWVGCIEANGYGRARFKGRATRVHKISYELTHGEIPPDKLVRHTCDNRACMNPAHLILGTQKDNVADMHSRGRNRAAGSKGATNIVRLGLKTSSK